MELKLAGATLGAGLAAMVGHGGDGGGPGLAAGVVAGGCQLEKDIRCSHVGLHCGTRNAAGGAGGGTGGVGVGTPLKEGTGPNKEPGKDERYALY